MQHFNICNYENICGANIVETAGPNHIQLYKYTITNVYIIIIFVYIDTLAGCPKPTIFVPIAIGTPFIPPSPESVHCTTCSTAMHAASELGSL